MKRRRKLITIVAVILIILMVLPLLLNALQGAAEAQAVSEQELKDLKAKAEELEKQSKDIKSQIDSKQYEQSEIIGQKRVLDEQMNITRAEIDNLTEQIATYDTLIAEKKLELMDAQAAEAKQFEEFKMRIRAMEENGTISYLAIILEADDFDNLLDRVNMVSEIMSSDRAMATQLEKTKNDTAEAKDALIKVQDEQMQTKTDLEAKEMELKLQSDEAAKMISDLESDIEAYEALLAANDKSAEEVHNQIDAMVAELERIERARQAAARVVGATGSFIWPTNNTNLVTSTFGTRYHPVLHYYRTHNGIDIGADYGTDILAADGGTVIISAYNDSYGNYIVINHGSGKTTLYAHMSKRIANVGDSVKQGQTIGLVGSTGVSTGPHIHFEITINGTRVNPLDYYTNYVVRD